MFEDKPYKCEKFDDSRVQAQVRANITGKIWCMYTDQSSNLQICPESDGPHEVIEVFAPQQWRDSTMVEQLESLCRDVSKLDDNGPDPNVADVKEKAITLLDTFFPSTGYFFEGDTKPSTAPDRVISDLMKVLKACLMICEQEVTHRYETDKPSWSALDYMGDLIRTVIPKAEGDSE